MLFCEGGIAEAKSRKSFKEKTVVTMSIISDTKQSDKNRQVIAGFGQRVTVDLDKSRCGSLARIETLVR